MKDIRLSRDMSSTLLNDKQHFRVVKLACICVRDVIKDWARMLIACVGHKE